MTPDARATLAQLLECLKVESQKVWDALDKQASYQAQLDRLYAQIEAEMQPETPAPLQLVRPNKTDRILTLLQAAPQGLWIKDLYQALQAEGYATTQDRVSGLVAQLFQKGRIRRIGLGCYAAVPPPSAMEASA